MILYFIKSGICLGIILSIYHFFLEREKMHQFNRFYLLFGLAFSFLAPLMTIGYASGLLADSNLFATIYGLETNPDPSEENALFSLATFSISQILKTIYWIFFAFFAMQFIYKLSTLIHKAAKHKKLFFCGAKLVLTNEETLPHTFWNFIFINENAYERNAIEPELFIHELAHATQRHSVDVVVVELLKTIFWFNPILHFYKHAIQLNHEFLADDAVIKKHQYVSDYQHLLLDKVSVIDKIYLASSLNFSLTKKRLNMMTKNTSRSRIYTLASMTIPLFVCLLMLFGNTATAQQNSTDKQEAQLQEIKDNFFKDATFICEDDDAKKIYRKYSDLSDEVKAAIPPPPPPPPTVEGKPAKIAPLKSGTIVHYRWKGDDKKVWIGNSKEFGPPPPPPVNAPPAPPEPPKAPNKVKG